MSDNKAKTKADENKAAKDKIVKSAKKFTKELINTKNRKMKNKATKSKNVENKKWPFYLKATISVVGVAAVASAAYYFYNKNYNDKNYYI